MSAPGDRADHWDATYTERGAEDVSWFQSEPHTSLALFDALGVRRDAAVIDVGGGASALVDRLVTHGYVDLTVLDISPVALDLARDRVGDAAKVEWVVSDVLTWAPDRRYDLWHDRAVFHFLTLAADRARYAECLHASLREDGWAIVATFAPDGPATCSGLPVTRWEAPDLAAELGLGLVRHHQRVHRTPWGTHQPFTIAVLQP